MESDDQTSPASASNKKLYIGIGVVVIILLIAFFSRDDSSFKNGEEGLMDPEISELVMLDEKISNDLSEIDSDGVKEFLADVKRYIALYEKVKKDQIRAAKRLDLGDPEAVREFVFEFDTLRKLDLGTDDCGGFALMIRSYTSGSDLSKGQQEDVQDMALETCEMMVALDVVKVSRDSETIDVNDEYVEVESSAIPVGHSFVAIKPENGRKDSIIITVDGKSEGTSEIITKEPVVGKKVTGVGDSATIAASVEPIFKMILNAWSKGLKAADVVDYLEEAQKSKATDFESQYNQTAFAWKRLDGLELVPGQVTFTSSGNTASPFTMSMPLVASYVTEYVKPAIEFRYNPETDSWNAGWATFNSLFKIVDGQEIPATYDPKVVIYDAADTCVDSIGFKRAKGVGIVKMGISGKNTFYMRTENGQPDQLVIKVPGNDTTVAMTTSGSASTRTNLPPQLLDLINSSGSTSFTIDELNALRPNRPEVECLADTDVLVAFFNG